jgi:hypothetical protein
MSKITIQSEIIMKCCKAENWAYEEARESFEQYYKGAGKNVAGGLYDKLKAWYKARKEGNVI